MSSKIEGSYHVVSDIYMHSKKSDSGCCTTVDNPSPSPSLTKASVANDDFVKQFWSMSFDEILFLIPSILNISEMHVDWSL